MLGRLLRELSLIPFSEPSARAAALSAALAFAGPLSPKGLIAELLGLLEGKR